jgi:undecaprenyl-phosphate 4-deoxy-4-formamido-L-arabinose transferase
MQTHPSQIFKLVHKIEEGYDLVYGIYPHVTNGPIKNLTSKINRRTSRVMLGRPKDVESSNFWIITKGAETQHLEI